jgi:hypothetical protein
LSSRSKAGITLDEEDVPHLLEALQAADVTRESMLFQLAESDEFTLLGSFKFSSDARNASISAAGMDAEEILDDMLRVTVPADGPDMNMDEIDDLRYGADAEVADCFLLSSYHRYARLRTQILFSSAFG